MGEMLLNGRLYGASGIRELTQAQYDALPVSKLTDGVLYCIKDDGIVEGDKYAPVIYSLEEREIGVWCDGKPLYQKSFEVTYNTTGSGAVNIDVNHQISDLDTVVVGYATVKSNSNTQYILYHNPDVTTQDEIAISYVNSSIIRLTLGHNYRSNYSIPMKFSITLQYTKTTDVPGGGQWGTNGVPMVHYDGDEKIIGTWFGETLYQKVIDVPSFGSGYTSVTHNLGIKNYVNVLGICAVNTETDMIHEFPFFQANDHCNIGVHGADSFSIYSSWNSCKAKICIQYTKTS